MSNFGHVLTRWRRWFRAVCLLLTFSALAIASLNKLTADDAKPSEKRTVVGKSATLLGMLMSREAPGKAWKLVPVKGEITSGDLLIGLPGAMLLSKDGAIRLTFLTDLDGNSPFPVKECAVILHDNDKV